VCSDGHFIRRGGYGFQGWWECNSWFLVSPAGAQRLLGLSARHALKKLANGDLSGIIFDDGGKDVD
jgi:hypothetical protein